VTRTRGASGRTELSLRVPSITATQFDFVERHLNGRILWQASVDTNGEVKSEMVIAKYWFLGICFTVAIMIIRPVFAGDEAAEDSVAVIRGSHVQVDGSSSTSARTTKKPAKSTLPDENVAVLRPAPGSFMRETSRLAAEAQAREEQAARETARETNRQVAEALQAVEEAAEAAAQLSSRRRVIVPLVGGVAIDPATGRHYGGGQSGVYVPLKDPNKK
jgi:hypothetical protein